MADAHMMTTIYEERPHNIKCLLTSSSIAYYVKATNAGVDKQLVGCTQPIWFVQHLMAQMPEWLFQIKADVV
jgi:hypothetical protein